MRQLFLSVFILISNSLLNAQNASRVTGNLMSNANFFITDEKIGATGTPQYDYQKFGAESWLNLNYSNWGFDMGLRFDMFNNSNLLNPTGSYSDEGIGRWFVQKKIDKFDFAAGYLYDQIGSGMIFRAYEERSLMIDNALYGARVGYHINENWNVRAFTGKQKRQFSTYSPVFRGLVLEGFIKPDSTSTFSLAPGLGVVGRTWDGDAVSRIVSEIATYQPIDSIGAQYNTYAATLFNTLSVGNFTWYVEGAYKTKDVLNNEFVRQATGIQGKLVNEEGYNVYSSVSWANSKFGATLETKRTQNFRFRSDPFLIGVQGQINYLTPMARQNTYRLTARFSPNTQELGEQAVQVELKYAPSKNLTFTLNVSDIQNLEGRELYREVAQEILYKYKRKWQALVGFQRLKYDILTYQGKGEYVYANTPYTEILYRFKPRRSLRIEASYLDTKQEFGSWAFALAEVGIAPHWLFYVSDMYKVPHDKSSNYPAEKTKFDGLHYPSVGMVYSYKSNRFSLAYVKQVEGINCAGGICRYEPTFHGVRMQLNSSF
ncbi:MAG: DUF6029 family protein [Chitinophagales bacterium]